MMTRYFHLIFLFIKTATDGVISTANQLQEFLTELATIINIAESSMISAEVFLQSPEVGVMKTNPLGRLASPQVAGAISSLSNDNSPKRSRNAHSRVYDPRLFTAQSTPRKRIDSDGEILTDIGTETNDLDLDVSLNYAGNTAIDRTWV